jgi:L-asparaginase
MITSMAQPDPYRHRRIAVLGLGGTIAMTPRDGGDAVVPALSTEQLLAAVPDLAAPGVTVETMDLRRLPSGSLTFDDLAELRAVIAKQLADGADGVVVTQGTDTIEETSYLLDLTHDRPEPVVLTGAMRNPSQAGADGPANLLAAVRTAADPQARDLGVLVVLADEVHAARRVRKTHTTSPDAFHSPNGGPLGVVVEGRLRLLNRLGHRTVVPTPPADTPHRRIGLYPVTFGDDGESLRDFAARYDGLVVAAFGAGHVPERMVAPLQQLAARMPVVLASRTGAGTGLATTYGYPGSERDLLARGLIRAGFLDPYKARILLHTLLAATHDRDTIATAFAVAGDYADPADWPWGGS